MPGNPRALITGAERRFPVRIRIAVPPEGLGRQHARMTAWLDENCGADGWAITPSGTRGVLNDPVSERCRTICHHHSARTRGLRGSARGTVRAGAQHLLGENWMAAKIPVRLRNRASFLGIRPSDAPASSAVGVQRSLPPALFPTVNGHSVLSCRRSYVTGLS